MGSPIFFCLLIMLQGAAGIVRQLIVLRELPTIHYGNELSLGLILTSWLFWAAIGSGLFAKLINIQKNRPSYPYILLATAGSLLSIITLIGIRLIRPLVGLIPGELVTFPFIVITTWCCVAPYAIIQGSLFTLAPHIVPGENDLRKKTNYVYVIETCGAMIGCLLYYFFAARHSNAFQGIFTANACQLFVLGICLFTGGFLSTKRKLLVLGILMLACVNTALIPQTQIHTYFQKKAYTPLSVIDTADSVYGSIVITRHDTQTISIFENGLHVCTTGNSFDYEEATQFALLAHPAPKSILLLGGGMNGCMAAIQAHPSLERISYIELDPLLVTRTLDHLPINEKEHITDSRVNLIHADARHFLLSTDEQYDLIIAQLPEPHTLQINRFYTQEFFRLIARHLTPEGIFSFTAPSSENFINNEQALFLASLKRTVENTFPKLTILPGNTAIFLASKKISIPAHSNFFLSRARERKIEFDYINDFFLPVRLSADKTHYLKQRLDAVPHTRINTDLYPISYYYDFIVWSAVIAPPLQNIIHQCLSFPAYVPYAALGLFGIIFLLRKRTTALTRVKLLTTIAAIGLTEISLEIIIILLFQIFFGNSYSHIGIIIGSYMGGLALGACVGLQQSSKKDSSALYNRIIHCQAMIVAFPCILALLAYVYTNYALSAGVITGSLLAITLCIGFIGGMQFPFVNTVYLTHTRHQHSQVGVIYASDLLGSALGAATVSSFIIPLFGIYHALFFLALLNGICFLSLLKK